MRRTTLAMTILASILAIGGCADTASTPTDVDDAASSPAVTDSSDAGTDSDAESEPDNAVDGISAAIADNQQSHFDADDLAYDESQVVDIALDGTSATADAGDVTIDGATVTITTAGAYALSGALSDGEVIVAAADTDDVILILDDADITNTDGAAVAVTSADEAVVLLADGSSNHLTDGATYAFPDADTDEPNAALYSAADLTIAGDGELVVEGRYNDGIASKDGLVIAAGTIDVVAADDGIRGKDYVVIDGGAVAVDAGGDGVKADNEEDADRGWVLVAGGAVTISTGDDGVQAATDVLVAGGELSVDAGWESGTGRAMQADVLVVVGDGAIDATAVDDAIHSNDTIAIDGGTLTLASGDDGVHGDHAVTINGGSTTITDAFEGIESEVITVNDGFIDITSDDDGLNVADADATATATAAGPADGGPGGGPGGDGPGGGGGGAPGGDEAVGDYFITINGGTTVITTTDALDEQGDGIDANGHIEMTGGVVVVSGATDTRNSAVDYSGGSFVMTGGTFIGTNVDGRNSEGIGAGSTQPSLYLTTGSTMAAGTLVHLATTNGEGLVTFEPANDYSVIVFSSPDLVDGDSYDVFLGGTVTGDSTTDLYEDAAYTPGDLAGTATASVWD